MTAKIIPQVDMREDPRGPSEEDRHTRKIADIGSYEVYRNRKDGVITLYPTEYHCGALQITRRGLAKLLIELRKKR